MGLDDVESLILLFDKYAHLIIIPSGDVPLKTCRGTHIVEQLGQFSDSLLDLLDILMAFPNFVVGGF